MEMGRSFLKRALAVMIAVCAMAVSAMQSDASVAPGRVFLGDTKGFGLFRRRSLDLLAPENGNAGVFYLHPNKDGAEVLGGLWAESMIRAL